MIWKSPFLNAEIDKKAASNGTYSVVLNAATKCFCHNPFASRPIDFGASGDPLIFLYWHP